MSGVGQPLEHLVPRPDSAGATGHAVPLDGRTLRWWNTLRLAAVGNLVAFAGIALLPEAEGRFHTTQFACATIYVLVCAFRSFYPRIDVERTVLVDHWLSSVVLGRTLATVAEMAFTLQAALFVQSLVDRGAPAGLSTVGGTLVPLIVVAQACCWWAVLTRNHHWHAAEEALWAVGMALLAGAFVFAWPSVDPSRQPFLLVGLLACAIGGWVMVGVDIPMYLRRARSEPASGRIRLSWTTGFRDALRRRELAGAWAVWRPEANWMTPYFTVGVWLSLAMAIA